MSAVVFDQLQQVQRALEQLYQLEPAPDVAEFVQMDTSHEREVLLLHHAGDTLQLRLLLPPSSKLRPGLCDHYLQAVEGVSHFLLVVERARRELPTTLLELELQAEVDKFALLLQPVVPQLLTPHAVHEWLFDRVTFLHPAESSEGERYRAAHRLAARFGSRLLTLAPASAGSTLRHFYGAGLQEKIRIAEAS